MAYCCNSPTVALSFQAYAQESDKVELMFPYVYAFKAIFWRDGAPLRFARLEF